MRTGKRRNLKRTIDFIPLIHRCFDFCSIIVRYSRFKLVAATLSFSDNEKKTLVSCYSLLVACSSIYSFIFSIFPTAGLWFSKFFFSRAGKAATGRGRRIPLERAIA